jgi:hypothetical protein
LPRGEVARPPDGGEYSDPAVGIGTLRHCSWIEICDMTFGKDPRTYTMASRILNEELEHEAWFLELLAHERDGKTIPSGHFRRGEPGHAPFGKNAKFYNP